MVPKYSRQDFVIRDIVVSIGKGGRGGTWMPGPDDETPPSPISPVASVLVNIGLIELVRATVAQAVESGDFEGIGQAFDPDARGGDSILRSAIHEIGAAVVASAAYAALGGSTALPNPDCGGTSLETIPPTLTPIVHKGLEIHRVSELPRLQKQLAETVEYLDQAAEARMPSGEYVGQVRGQLERALKSLPDGG